MLNTPTYPCIPAKAGNQYPTSIQMNQKGHWVSALAGMIGVVSVGCSPITQNDGNIGFIDSKVEQPANLEPIVIKVPEYTTLAYASPEDIGLSVGMSPNEAMTTLRDQGFQYLDMIGSDVVYGECAGASEILTYYKREHIEGRYLIVFFDADFRSELTNGECKRILYSVSPISIKEEK